MWLPLGLLWRAEAAPPLLAPAGTAMAAGDAGAPQTHAAAQTISDAGAGALHESPGPNSGCMTVPASAAGAGGVAAGRVRVGSARRARFVRRLRTDGVSGALDSDLQQSSVVARLRLLGAGLTVIVPGRMRRSLCTLSLAAQDLRRDRASFQLMSSTNLHLCLKASAAN